MSPLRSSKLAENETVIQEWPFQKLILNLSMKKFYVLGLIVALSTVLVVPRVHAAGSSSVVFSEIAWGGSQKSTADEWLEITNLGGGAVDVSGWTMTGLATSGGILTVPANTLLAPGGTYVIANYQMGSSSTLLISPDLVTTAVSIPNTALNFALLDEAGNIVDSLVDPGTPNAGSNTTFATMERSSDLSWVTAEVSTNLDGGQLGSPGVSGHLAAPIVAAPATVLDETPSPLSSSITQSSEGQADSPIPLGQDSVGQVNEGENTPEAITSIPAESLIPVIAVTDTVVVEVPVTAPVESVVSAPTEIDPIVVTDPIVAATPSIPEEPASVAQIETVAAPIEPVVTPVTIPDAVPDVPAVTTVETTTLAPSEVIVPSITTTPDPIITVPAESNIDSPTTTTPTVPEVAIEQPAVEPVAISGSSILITSLLPSPNTGENETLTLTNVGDVAVVIDGYTLVDASGKATALTGSVETDANFIVTNPAGKLNNDGDSISLFDAAGTQIDAVAYGTDEVPAPKKNVVLQLIDGAWSTATAEITAAPIEMVDSPISDVAVVEEEVPTALNTLEAADVTIAQVVAEVVPEVPGVPKVPEQSEQIVATPVVTEPATSDVVETLVVDPVIASSVVVTEAASTTPIVSSMTPVDLVITSLLPAPSTGGDEWVEITNRSEVSIDLSSYSLVDASGTVTSLSGTIDAGASSAILNPKGNLNNDSDSVTLLDSAGNAVDSVMYGGDASSTPKKDEVVTFATFSPTLYAQPDSSVTTNASTAESADTAVATSSSHGGQTATSALATATSSATTTHSARTADSVVKAVAPKTTAVKKTVKTSTSSTKKSSVAARNVSISEIASLTDETLVTLEGTVVANPGVIGKRSFFVDGLEVYQSQDDLATVSIGDHVRVTGTVSVLSDHRRVNIKAGAVTVLGSSTPIVHDYAAGLPYGSLVRITGTVSARDGNAVVLDTDAGNVTVTLGNSVTMKWADVASKKVTVTGVLKSSNGSATVVLRSAEDVVVTADAIDQAPSVSGTSAAQNFPWSIVGLATVTMAGLGAWFWRMKPRSSLTSLTLKPNNV